MTSTTSTTSTIPPALTVLTEAHPGWDQARQTWNLTVDQRPAAIARPETAQGVQAAIEYARERGLRVAAQSTGHNATPLGALSDTLLLKTDAMRQVTVDPQLRTARVGAGAVWKDVTDAAGDHGLAALAGSAPNVGVAGYTLGGGMSWLGRRYGLATNNVDAFEAVTADGTVRHVDATHDADLFWALRGGGGSFAVVTEITLRLFPVREVTAGLLWWPLDAAADVLHGWRQLTQGRLPDELTTVARLMRLPDDPHLPDEIRGRGFVVIDVIYLGAEADARRLLAPLLDLGPVTDTIEVMPARDLGQLHMDPEGPTAFVGDGALLTGLPVAAVDEILRLAGPTVDTPLMVVEFRQLGGALGRVLPGNGALAAVAADYVVFAGGVAADPESVAAVGDSAQAVLRAMAPWVARQMYLNLSETRRDPATFWAPPAYERLRRIKAEVDPEDLIRANQPIPPAAHS